MNNGIAKRGFGRAMMKKGGYLQSPVINSVKPKPTKPKPKVVEVRDINKNGKKDGFEVARAKGRKVQQRCARSRPVVTKGAQRAHGTPAAPMHHG